MKDVRTTFVVLGKNLNEKSERRDGPAHANPRYADHLQLVSIFIPILKYAKADVDDGAFEYLGPQ